MTTTVRVEHQPIRIRDELPQPTRPDRRFWWAVGMITTVAIALRVLTVIGYAPANLAYSLAIATRRVYTRRVKRAVLRPALFRPDPPGWLRPVPCDSARSWQ